jgi:hypothetical protein
MSTEIAAKFSGASGDGERKHARNKADREGQWVIQDQPCG